MGRRVHPRRAASYHAPGSRGQGGFVCVAVRCVAGVRTGSECTEWIGPLIAQGCRTAQTLLSYNERITESTSLQWKSTQETLHAQSGRPTSFAATLARALRIAAVA